MSFQTPYAAPRTARRETTAVFAQTMFLVSVALGFCVAGTLIGRDLSTGAARACSFAGLGMLLVQGFLGGRIRALRVGAFAIGWMCVLALLIGFVLRHSESEYYDFASAFHIPVYLFLAAFEIASMLRALVMIGDGRIP